MPSHKFLAYLSQLAYENEVHSIAFKTTKIFYEKTSTECFVLTNDREQIVVFRGTKIDLENWYDIVTDLKVKAINGIHQGFLEAFKSIKSELVCLLDVNKKTMFCGHSLGGALAILSYFELKEIKNKSCVTFGSPRVFTKEKIKTLKDWEKVTRYENKADPVPFLPPFLMGYRHIGNEISEGSFFDLTVTSLKNQIKSHGIENYIEVLEWN